MENKQVRKSRRRRDRDTFPFLTFAVMAVLAIAIGVGLGRYFILPLISPTAGEPAPGAEKPPVEMPETALVSVDLEPLVLYRVQLGSFIEAGRAEKLAASVWNDGFPAGIVEYQPDKVAAGVFSDKAAATEFGEKLASAGYTEIWVAPTRLNPNSFSFSGTNAEYLNGVKGTLETISSVIALESEFWADSWKGSPSREWGPGFKALKDQVGQLRQQLSAAAAPEDWQGRHGDLVALLEEAETNLDEVLAMVNDETGDHFLAGMNSYLQLIGLYNHFTGELTASGK